MFSKRSSLLATSLMIAMLGVAQWQVNPQIGLTYQNLTDAPEGAE